VAEVEKYLLPHFIEFLKDQVWAIRKVCADLFSSFALRCTRKTRETVLTDCFIRLLDDNSRWVKISAYKSLGPFISTFIPQKTDELATEQLSSNNSNNVSLLQEDEASSVERPATSQQKANEAEATAKTTEELDDQVVTSLASKILPVSDQATAEPSKTDAAKEEDEKKEENEYSNFVYWRNSLPNLEDSLNLISPTAPTNTPTSSDEAAVQTDKTAVSVTDSSNQNSSSQETAKPAVPDTTTLTSLLNNSNLLEKIINSKSNESTNFYSIASFYNPNNQNQHHYQQIAQKSIEQLTSELKQVIN
jgi:hypothetical protein